MEKGYNVVRHYLCSFLWLLLISLSASVSAKPVVIGYVPSFRDMIGTIDVTDLSLLTHINISFANPDADGVLIKNNNLQCMPNALGNPTPVSDIQYLVTKSHQAGVKVLLSIAGGVIPVCSGNWQTLLKPASRQLLVDNLISLIDELNIDGIDVDIEGEVLTAIDKEGNYTPFVKALSEKLIARGKLLTCATASYQGGMIPISSIPYFDYINVMSYDLVGPSWGVAGAEHSTYAMAASDIDLWRHRGVLPEKLVLGVPFYGYGFGNYSSDFAYKEVLAKFGAEASKKDLVGDACVGCSYITYNGIPTIQAKTQLAMQKAGGVMIWELSQDASGPSSLLKTINDTLRAASSTSSSQAVANSSQPSLSSNASASSMSSAVSNISGPRVKSSGGAIDGLAIVLLALVGFAKTRRSLYRR